MLTPVLPNECYKSDWATHINDKTGKKMKDYIVCARPHNKKAGPCKVGQA